MASTMKQAVKASGLDSMEVAKLAPELTAKADKAKAVKVTETLKTAAKEVSKVEPIFSPSQIAGQFASNLDKETAKKFTPLYDELLSEFASEAQSRIEIGGTLVQIREVLGELFRKFLEDCVVSTLRKSLSTCYSYIGLYQVFSLKFARNKVVKTALSRIWGAEGCFDTENGELKPVVDQAIGATGGIPESTDSLTCEVWARSFVRNVDKLVKGSRQATPGGRKWDSTTLQKKFDSVVANYRSFITNETNVTSIKACELLTAILVESMVEMSATEIKAAMDNATKTISERKLNVKKAHESLQQAQATA